MSGCVQRLVYNNTKLWKRDSHGRTNQVIKWKYITYLCIFHSFDTCLVVDDYNKLK